jgi:hypothetical protein
MVEAAFSGKKILHTTGTTDHMKKKFRLTGEYKRLMKYTKVFYKKNDSFKHLLS